MHSAQSDKCVARFVSYSWFSCKLMQCILKDFLVQGVQVTVLQAISYDGKIWRVQKIDYQVSERKVLLPIHWWTLRFRHCNRPGNCQKNCLRMRKIKSFTTFFSTHTWTDATSLWTKWNAREQMIPRFQIYLLLQLAPFFFNKL